MFNFISMTDVNVVHINIDFLDKAVENQSIAKSNTLFKDQKQNSDNKVVMIDEQDENKILIKPFDQAEDQKEKKFINDISDEFYKIIQNNKGKTFNIIVSDSCTLNKEIAVICVLIGFAKVLYQDGLIDRIKDFFGLENMRDVFKYNDDIDAFNQMMLKLKNERLITFDDESHKEKLNALKSLVKQNNDKLEPTVNLMKFIKAIKVTSIPWTKIILIILLLMAIFIVIAVIVMVNMQMDLKVEE